MKIEQKAIEKLSVFNNKDREKEGQLLKESTWTTANLISIEKTYQKLAKTDNYTCFNHIKILKKKKK